MRAQTFDCYSVEDLRAIARRRLPKGLFEFMDRGNDDEIAVRDSRLAFEQIKLKPKVLVDISRRTQAITLLGEEQKMPMAIGPTGSAGLA